ncbi:energy transducer TonB [Tenacibaculum piscium]|uniref:energy transducer TonB n=1 Tax=Tenacibaculum piscium TaxID=1458515 RepID=UPI001F370AE9|nr:energy transducer TonB [Tenacibaculum piscium]
MKKLLFLALLLIVNLVAVAQKVCESPDESADIDLNTITKCAVSTLEKSDNKRSRKIRVKVSARKKMLNTNNLSTSGISSGVSSEINSEIIKTRQKIDLKQNIEELKNKLSKEEIKEALTFPTVDEIPSFSACNEITKEEVSDCFNNEMMKHISDHFNYPGEAVRQSLQGEVWVRFIIDKNGYVKNIKTLGPDDAEILNNEAIRVVSLLPRFKPAEKQGKRVSVKYGFPINFSLEE